ncbi:MAG: DUF86 domain-containing protein [Myxococcaceae bacterium]
MNKNRLPDYIKHIQQAAIDACSFVEGLDKENFLADKRTQQAIIMNLIVRGEAAGKIMDGYGKFSENTPEVPWRGMRGMRNRIAHGYFEIDLDIVWDTVQKALPKLIKQLASLPVQDTVSCE